MRGIYFYTNPRRGHSIRTRVAAQALENRRARDDADVKLFVLSFAAFFVCFSTFLL